MNAYDDIPARFPNAHRLVCMVEAYASTLGPALDAAGNPLPDADQPAAYVAGRDAARHGWAALIDGTIDESKYLDYAAEPTTVIGTQMVAAVGPTPATTLTTTATTHTFTDPATGAIVTWQTTATEAA